MVTFALAPGRVNKGIIDYSSSEGIKHFNKATEPTKKLFNGQAENLHYFLTQVSDRIKDFGWESITTITNSEDLAVDMVTEYGQYTLEDVQVQATEWHGEDNQTREQQNSYMMFRFLRESLEVDFHNKITLFKNSYLIDDE